jgi:4-carboxymuconolactone decarboxylase
MMIDFPIFRTMQPSNIFLKVHISSLGRISPELSGLMEQYGLEDVLINKHLTNRQHHYSLAAMLMAAKAPEEWLIACWKDALMDDCPVEELMEVCLQLTAYIGFPTSGKGLELLKKTWNEMPTGAEWPIKPWCTVADRYQQGEAQLEWLEPGRTGKLMNDYGSFAPDYVRATLEMAYGDLYSRTVLDKPTQQAIRVAALSALGYAAVPLTFHMKAGIKVGLSIAAQAEIILQLTAITGFPAAMNAMNQLKALIEE